MKLKLHLVLPIYSFESQQCLRLEFIFLGQKNVNDHLRNGKSSFLLIFIGLKEEMESNISYE